MLENRLHKILYVEDDNLLQEQYKNFFQRKTDNLILAKNGKEGFELFKEHSDIELIITDIRMPIMTGLDMISSIREENKEIPIIVTSAFNEYEYLLEAINLGVTRYILKPFNRKLLKKTIEETISYINLQKKQDQHNEDINNIFNTISDSIVLTDFDFLIKKSNKSFDNLFLNKNTLDKMFIDLFDEEAKSQLLNFTSKLKENLHIENFEINTTINDKKVFLSINASIMSSDETILITLKDITNLNKYKILTKEHQKLIDENIITSRTDLKGVITYASQAFCKISGYSKDELIGKTHSIVRHPEMDDKVYKNLWETITKNETWIGEFKNIAKSGTEYWVRATIKPIFIDDKKIGYSSLREDITDKKALIELTITDGLTKLYNRRYFNEKIEEKINFAKRRKEELALLVLDIDYFKQYNDNYGHQQGDEVLKRVSKVLLHLTRRADDFAFRVGGEEFAILLEPKSKEDAISFANKIIEEIRDEKIVHEYNLNKTPYVTISIGLSCKNAKDINSSDEFYKEVDELLYKAKDNGRNRVEHN